MGLKSIEKGQGGTMENDILLSVKGLTKRYSGITVLNRVDMEVHQGEIHALIGENGAGKSTLCKSIAGAIEPSSGTITICGKSYEKLSPAEAKASGIAMVYQEFNLVPELTVYENLFIGKEIRKGPFIDTKSMKEQSQKIFKEMNIAIDCEAKIKDISVAYCQLVEIAKALLEQSRVLILDEPTAPLTNNEINILFKVLGRLREKGISMIYISHRLEEIFRMCDRITVLRDGAFIKCMDTKQTNKEELIHLMIGRELSKEFPERGKDVDHSKAQVVLKVTGLTNHKIKNVSFELKKGEILGIAGLVGAGRTETVRALFGADSLESGEISIKGKVIRIKDPAAAIKHGIGLIPEDRKREGLMLGQSISSNISLVVIKNLSKGLFINDKKEKNLLKEQVERLQIKTGSLEYPASSLSGGNQQKIVLAKWLSTSSDVLIFDEPTRGIDVGAKKEIYDFLFQLREAGKSLIVISSEMSEILNLSDRILVMHEGEISGELSNQEATQDGILTLASGLK